MSNAESIKVKVHVKPFEPKRIRKGMLVLWGGQLMQINGKDPDGSGHWLIGDEYTNVAMEPEFFCGSNKRTFQPVVIVPNR